MTDRDTKDWIRNASDEKAVKNGCRFDGERGEFVCDWIETYCVLYEGDFAGDPMVLMPWQRDMLMRLFSWVKWSDRWKRDVRRFRRGSIWVPKKNGKALALDTPIPIPGGWKHLGDIQVGDELFSETGEVCRVTHAHPVLIDEATYRVSFSNGESVVCNGDHLWETTALQQTVCSRGRGKVFAGNQHTGAIDSPRFTPKAVRTTTEIAKSLHRSDGACNHSISTPSPIVLPDRDLPISPYVFGCWLGDGDSDCARITCHADDFPTYESEFVAGGYSVAHQKSTAGVKRFRFQGTGVPERTTLKAIGVFRNKHIPADYLRASENQRVALLQGLMDTDGTISKDGKCLTYTTKLKALADGVCELLSTLGVKYKTRVRTPVISNVRRAYYTIQFHAFVDTLPAFRLPRKLERMRHTSALKNKGRSRTIQITNVERIHPVPVRCITVDNPSGLFLCGRTMIPTHNSPTLAALALYLLCGDGEQGQKVFLGAKDGTQAREIAGTHAVEMVNQSGPLSAECEINKNLMRITHVPTRSFMQPLSSSNSRTQQSKEGINGSVIIDETHVVDKAFIRRIERAGISRSEPLHLEFSTAGTDPDSYGKEQFDYGEKVISGEIENERYFYVAYAAPQDVTDEAILADPVSFGKQANPSWGVTVGEEEYIADLQISRRTPSDWADFKTYRLNIWQTSTSPWLGTDVWKKCLCDIDPEMLRGRKCWAGLDLAQVRDMTALVLVFPGDAEEEYYLLPYFWLPSATIERYADRTQFKQWVQSGHLLSTPGDVTNYGAVREKFMQLSGIYDIQGLVYDPYRAEQLTQEIEQGVHLGDEVIVEGTGIPRLSFGQTIMNYAEPTQTFERLAIEGKIRHFGHPVLAWQIGHAVKTKPDNSGNYRIVKPDRLGIKTVDGVQASIMGLAQAMADDHQEAGFQVLW